MAIKKLQNDFTTPEQSKRLLELGVPADSANCYYNEKDYTHPRFVPIGYSFIEYCSNAFGHIKEDYEPCWSVGRLMEIINICNLTAEKPWVHIERDNIHAMITAIIDGVNNRMLDFSKLEG